MSVIASSSTSPDLVTVSTSDGKIVTLSRDAAAMSKTIEDLVVDLGTLDNIPLHSVNESVMLKVKEYLERKVVYPNPPPTSDIDPKERRTDDIEPWDKEFMAAMNQEMMFDLIMAANYLDIKPLLDLGCKTVANIIRSKTVEEIRITFNLKNEFTPEEEKKVREENEWCDERS